MSDPTAPFDNTAPSESAAQFGNAAQQAQAGWYPAAAGSSQLRWWDGEKWTEHVHDSAQPGVQGAGYASEIPPKAPEGTDPNTIWAWLIAALPILSLIGSAIYFSSLSGTFGNIISNSTQAGNGYEGNLASPFTTVFTPSYGLLLLLSFASYALIVIFAYRDVVALRAKGVVRPFHWAWAFLEAPWVYIIGRSVVVRRRTGRGFGPLWLLIGVTVLSVVVLIAIMISLFANVASQIPTN